MVISFVVVKAYKVKANVIAKVLIAAIKTNFGSDNPHTNPTI